MRPARDTDAALAFSPWRTTPAIAAVPTSLLVSSFFDGAGRILLVQPRYKDHWDIPGGYVESGETPAQAAAREVHEELGIETAVGTC